MSDCRHQVATFAALVRQLVRLGAGVDQLAQEATASACATSTSTAARRGEGGAVR
ncbi:MAG: hypothetical protein ACRDZR_12270 [Acidimicrobiales bacterium]